MPADGEALTYPEPKLSSCLVKPCWQPKSRYSGGAAS